MIAKIRAKHHINLIFDLCLPIETPIAVTRRPPVVRHAEKVLPDELSLEAVDFTAKKEMIAPGIVIRWGERHWSRSLLK